MDKLKLNVPKLPGWGSALIKVGLAGGATLYVLSKSIYNVEGGHRAVVFNRVTGVKDKVHFTDTVIMSAELLCYLYTRYSFIFLFFHDNECHFLQLFGSLLFF